MVHQQELLYNVEFQLAEMERRISRAQGKRSDDEVRAMNARIERLTGMLENVNAEHTMLLEQCKNTEDDLLAARRDSVKINKEKGKLDDTITVLKQESDGVVRAVSVSSINRRNPLVNVVLNLTVASRSSRQDSKLRQPVHVWGPIHAPCANRYA